MDSRYAHLVALLLLSGCVSIDKVQREYAKEDAYHRYLDRKAACIGHGIWITTFPLRDETRQHPVDYAKAHCARQAL